MLTSITLAGYGGQGIIKTSVLLGQAAVREGKFALQNPTYGPQSRGGISKGDVIISDEQIYEIEPEEVDVLVAMSQQSYDKYKRTLKPGGVLIIDSDLVGSPGDTKPYRLGSFQATELAANRFGNRLITGTLALGFMAAMVDAVGRKSLQDVLSEGVSKDSKKANLEAFGCAWKMGRSVAGGKKR